MFFSFVGVKVRLIFLCIAVFLFQSVSANLLITEVYYDGTDEWIELTNIDGPDFSGSLQIAGAKASLINLSSVSIPQGASLIFGDTLSQISNPAIIALTGMGLSMSDTSALNITISDFGQTLDTFAVSASDMLTYDNTKTSFARVWVDSVLQILPTCSGSVANVYSSFVANPGLVAGGCITTTGDILTGDVNTGGNNTGDVGSGIDTNLTGSSENTGSILTGIDLTGSSIGLLSGMLLIQEIHAKTSGCLDEYVIITATQDYQGVVELYGGGSSSNSIFVNVDMHTGDSILIADTSGFSHLTHAIIIPSLTLTDGGEELRILISGQVVDNVNYLGNSDGLSFFYQSSENGVRQFTNIATPSLNLTCDTTLPPSPNFALFTGGLGYCDIHLLSSTDLGSGVYSVNFSVNGQFASLCNQESQWMVNGNVTQNNTCSFSLDTSPGIQQIQFKQFSGSTLLCQDELILNSIQNSTMSTDVVNTCQDPTNNNTSLDYDCSIRLQNSDTFMRNESINIVGQVNGSDLSNSQSSYTCSRSSSGGLVLTGCNPGYFQYTNPGIYALDLTVMRNDGKVCHTHTDINYPGDGTMVYNSGADSMSGLVCDIRFQNTGPYDAGDSINVIAQANTLDITSSSSYSCSRSNSGGLVLTGCNPGYFHYDQNGSYDLNLQVTRSSDGATCLTNHTLDIGTVSGGNNTGLNNRSCDIRFQNTGPYYPGSSINIVGQVNSTDLSNTQSTYSCSRSNSGGLVLTGCNPGYFSLIATGLHTLDLHIQKSDGSSCDVQKDISILPHTSSSSSSSSASSSTTSSTSVSPKTLSCDIRFQNTGPYTIGDKINVIAQQDQTDIQNSQTSYTCLWTLGDGRTLTQCNPSSFAYTGEGSKQVVLKVIDRYGQTCQSDEYLLIDLNQEPPELISSSGLVQMHDTGIVAYSGTHPPIDLKCVMTNPLGSDTKQELITLTLLTGGTVDLKDYRLVVAGKNKLLSGYLRYGQDIDIYNSWGLSNTKSGCISLVNDEQIVDTLCYPVLQEGETYCEGVEREGASGTGVAQTLKKTQNSLKKDQIDKLKASCQKKIDRLQTSKDKMKARYEKRILGYKKQITTVKGNYAKYRSKTKTRVDLLNGELYLYRNYTTLVNAELKKSRPAVLDHSDHLRHYLELLQQGKKAIKEKRTHVQVGPCQSLPYYKLKDIIRAEQELGIYYLAWTIQELTPLPYHSMIPYLLPEADTGSLCGLTRSGSIQNTTSIATSIQSPPKISSQSHKAKGSPFKVSPPTQIVKSGPTGSQSTTGGMSGGLLPQSNTGGSGSLDLDLGTGEKLQASNLDELKEELIIFDEADITIPTSDLFQLDQEELLWNVDDSVGSLSGAGLG